MQVGSGGTKFEITLSGFDTSDGNKEHGFHIHKSDDVTAGCNSMGGHYNPAGTYHSSRSSSMRFVRKL